MVKCQICGAEVFSGWICGIVPAADKDKLGLCADHDTPENRALVQERWEKFMREQMRSTLEQRRKEEKPVVRYAVRINFLGGGVKTLTCRAYDVNQDKDLLVLNEEGELDFYPLQHIRNFTVHEVTVEDVEAKTADDPAASKPALPGTRP